VFGGEAGRPFGRPADPNSAPPASKRSEINGANAAHSTGPRTPTGKLASSRNSLKHGLASGTFIIHVVNSWPSIIPLQETKIGSSLDSAFGRTPMVRRQ
jgi:hypothetical protein